MKHFTESEQREFLDLGNEAPDAGQFISHLKRCPECSAVLTSLGSFDRLVQRSIRAQAPKEFTNDILQKLHIGEAPTVAWRALQYLAPMVALGIIGVIVFGVFQFTGTFKHSEVETSV